MADGSDNTQRTQFETIRDGLDEEEPGFRRAQPCVTVAWHRSPAFIGSSALLPVGPTLLGRGGALFPGPVLDDQRISRRHLELSLRGGEVRACDLGSTNGSTLNGLPLTEVTLLERGDVLGLGQLLLVFSEVRPRISWDPHPELIGNSDAVADLLYQIEVVAPHPTTVLILGETGTGKELAARAVHEASGRKGKFIAVNCGALADTLLQAELFGHVRGAFSGAGAQREGLVVAAEGGTLFLDEIGEASPALQATLLRLLQEGEVRPVGSDRTRHVDARFLAATNRDLDAEVKAGRFRADLLARLKGWVLDLPPLRERREDILPIAMHHARRRLGASARISRDLAYALLTAPWQGNVRELVAVIERLCIEAAGESALWRPPWLEIRRGRPTRPPVPEPTLTESGLPPAEPSAPPAPRERPSAEELRALLIELDGNVRRLAKHLGIGRTTIYRWLKAAGIDPDELRG